MNYVFLTEKQLAMAIMRAPVDTVFDFTFDTEEDIQINGEQRGWHGAKITRIFDEELGVFVVGYYSGGNTRAYDIYKEFDGNVQNGIEEALCDYAFSEGSELQKFCVEVTDANKEYLNKIN